ncbi:asparagine synthase-related protein [Pseudonocardia sp. RS010]|uniref:asparagine synthase-related protein n=1 Tax=Pseudonocardia sp. RS010 TaxID=3385979 RepID=UPI0039A2BB2D
MAERLTTHADLDGVFQALAGAAYLIGSVDGHVRIQGNATGLRTVFHTKLNGVPVAADRADILATLARADIDEEVLALRVVCGGQLPSPAAERPIWSGISAVPAGDCLLWNRNNERIANHWRPPAAELSVAEAAVGLHDALKAATRPQSATAGRLSTDLSGGMDSTSLAFLAAPDSPDLLTFRLGEAEAGNDDSIYAAQAIQALKSAEHLVLSPQELPAVFSEPGAYWDPEQPYPLTRTAARTLHCVRVLVEHGSRRHLAGHGGDELFSPQPGYLHHLLRRRPLTALQHARAQAAMRHWPLLSMLRAITSPTGPAEWWRTQAEQLTEPLPPLRQPMMGWGLGALRALGWVTDAAIELSRTGLRRAADDARPLGSHPGTHQLLLLTRTNALHYRMLSRLYSAAGVELDLPFYDDRVLDAVLRVPIEDYAGPWRYKPLLVEAMRGIVPQGILGRSTKGEFSEEIRTGLRANLPEILAVFSDSTLAARGLIDPDQLRIRLTAPQQDNRTVFALEYLLGCENWLRAVTTTPPPAHPRSGTTILANAQADNTNRYR